MGDGRSELGRFLRMAAVLLALQALPLVDAGVAMALTLTSSAFQPGGTIPSKYTCEGDDISPPLAIDSVPAGAKSLALIMDDPDAPDPKAPKRVWVHWVVYNLPPDTKSLPENAGEGGLPKGAVIGVNDRKQAAYHGPCTRAASLFPQALRPRHRASSRRYHQVRA